MTDSNDDKTLNGPGKKTLTLKPSGMSQGTVRQDMGRGRTKAVVVETRKRRPTRPEDEKPVAPIASAPVRAPQPRPPETRPMQQTTVRPQPQAPRPDPARPRTGVVLNQLSAGEIDARRRALAEAQI